MDVDTQRQQVHKRVIFIASICCLFIAGAGYIRPLLLEPAQLTKARPFGPGPSCDGRPGAPRSYSDNLFKLELYHDSIPEGPEL